jgi:glc operon protein GlcG
VRRAFAHGATGDTIVSTPGFRINASRRDGTGEAEIHRGETDIFYVLDGEATVVTGGQILNSHEVSPGEVRGAGLRGGREQRLTSGDVLTIPNGVPHWFKEVRRPLHYFVVKSLARP